MAISAFGPVHCQISEAYSCLYRLKRLLRVADIYGPSEGIIGKYLQSSPGARSKVQVLTKFCCFGQSMDFADNPKYVKRVTPLPAAQSYLPAHNRGSHARSIPRIAAHAW